MITEFDDRTHFMKWGTRIVLCLITGTILVGASLSFQIRSWLSESFHQLSGKRDSIPLTEQKTSGSCSPNLVDSQLTIQCSRPTAVPPDVPVIHRDQTDVHIPSASTATPASNSDRAPAIDDKGDQSETDSKQQDCRANNAALGVVITDPKAPCVQLGEIIGKLRKGTFKFNKPNTATLEEHFPMRLVLLTAEGQAVTLAGLPGTVQTRERPFAQFLEATLTGDDFEINPAGPQARIATLSQPVEWEWRIKPIAPGTKSLTIDVAANIQIGSDKNRIQITTLHESVEIQVTIFQRIKSYLAGANGILAAVAAAVTSLAGLLSFFPKVRRFFMDYVVAFFRPKRSKRKRA